MPSWLETTGSGSTPRTSPAVAPAKASSDDAVDFALLRRPPTGEPPAILDDAIETTNGQSGGQSGGQSKPRADDPFGPLARELGPGTICLVRGHGIGERLARHYDRYALILERREVQGIRDDGRVGTFVLRIEDPSELLGWALRRAEEGARVIIETAALTAAGARRSLLGTQAGPTATAWLDALPVHWLAEDDGRWTLAKT